MFMFMQYGRLERSDLSTKTLWVTVWSWDRHGRNKFLGEVRLSLSTLDLTNTSDVWYNLQDYMVGSLPTSVPLECFEFIKFVISKAYHCCLFPIQYYLLIRKVTVYITP